MKQMTLCRIAATLAVAVLMSAAFRADEPELHGVWQLKDGSQLNFRGQKVAAAVITDDTSLQMSGEEALVRELNARGATGVATYRIAPKEELKSAEKARPWFDKAGNYASDTLHIVERISARSPDALNYEATIEDPAVFTRPWKISFPLYRRLEKNLQLTEFRCVEYSEEIIYGHLRKPGTGPAPTR